VKRPSVLLALTGLAIDGGIAGVNRCIARALEECAAAGGVARVDRVLLQEDPARPAPPPARGEQRLSRNSQLRFVWDVWRSYRRHRHERVFFDHVGPARAIALPLPGWPPPDCAVFVHGVEFDQQGERRSRALRRAQRIIVNSEFTASVVRRLHPTLAARIRVVPLCIDPERIRAWEALGLDADPPRRECAALIVGRMLSEERGKGHDALLEAWSEVQRRAPAAELWVVGAGNDVARLRERAGQLGLGSAVRFFGRVPDDELARLYRRASVFAMPSRQEGFGLVYAEAMWHGLPCVASTADAASQVVQDGATGRLVPYGDRAAIAEAVGSLLADPDARRRLGEAGRARARSVFGYARFRDDLLPALGLAAD
jgi:phosphatidylinositol alpha-1,6-mannosyltransferase